MNYKSNNNSVSLCETDIKYQVTNRFKIRKWKRVCHINTKLKAKVPILNSDYTDLIANTLTKDKKWTYWFG